MPPSCSENESTPEKPVSLAYSHTVCVPLSLVVAVNARSSCGNAASPMSGLLWDTFVTIVTPLTLERAGVHLPTCADPGKLSPTP